MNLPPMILRKAWWGLHNGTDWGVPRDGFEEAVNAVIADLIAAGWRIRPPPETDSAEARADLIKRLGEAVAAHLAEWA